MNFDSPLTLENKRQQNLHFVDLYCIKNHPCAKNGLPFERRKLLWKNFPKAFHINSLMTYFQVWCGIVVFFPSFSKHYLNIWTFVPIDVWDKFIMFRNNLKLFCHSYHGAKLGASLPKVLDNTSLTITFTIKYQWLSLVVQTKTKPKLIYFQLFFAYSSFSNDDIYF